ncbi:DUF6707 family protein [Microbulbifer sp. SSSA005]|uniref:DUF6707 family protein n=1 Tax=Microbulbifer sp. SSSA005 TaxID=3243378 RepID=UPI004039603A
MNIDKITNKNKPIASLVKSLSKGYKLTTDKDQNKFLRLSIYLYALGQDDLALEIANFITSSCEYNGNENVWNSVGFQIVLLTRIYRLKGIESIQIARLKEEDIISSRYTVEMYTDELLEEALETEKLVESSSQKYKCEGYGQMALEFMYCQERAKMENSKECQLIQSKTEPLVQKYLANLAQALE